ncbi:MAG: cysteine desulfurase [Campylobacteraceae bacterium]|nr:cysteine desulfurase [Campylobacteraceae bacterium]
MYKLNFIQYPKVEKIEVNETLSLQALKDNDEAEAVIESFKTRFNFNSLNSFSFSEDGFLSLMIKLGGKIIVSKGESQAIIDAANRYKDLGFDLEFISLNRNGQLNYDEIKSCDFAFISSYIMDTYVKVDLQKVKELSGAKLISNVSATLDVSSCDIAIFDAYKLTGFSFSSILLHNEILEEQYLALIDITSVVTILKAVENFTKNIDYKQEFKIALEEELKEDIYFFVDPNETLEYTLHFGLKGIKAREIIRSLALGGILVTNGEGCSLGLSKPSRVLSEMGYEELETRWALSLSFKEKLSSDDINLIVKAIGKKYRQIKRLG